jgi:phosphatidylinositol transfer protein SFH5
MRINILTRNLNVDKTQEKLIAMLRWREEYGANEAANEAFPDELFGNIGHVYGKDRRGRPVV